MILPDIDDWEVCRRLKTDGRTNHIPIAVLTAGEDPHTRVVPRKRDAPGI